MYRQRRIRNSSLGKMAKQEPKTVAELLSRIDAAWKTFTVYIDSLSEAQLTQPTDAAGWTAKDHLIHIATWEDTLNALLDKKPMWERIGIDKALWSSPDIDAINAFVQKREQQMPLDEVRRKHREIHQELLTKLRALSDADLQAPIRDQAGSSTSRAVLRSLIADTYEAYEEHTPWIAAIVAKA
jgi:hypothetical protein